MSEIFIQQIYSEHMLCDKSSARCKLCRYHGVNIFLYNVLRCLKKS